MSEQEKLIGKLRGELKRVQRAKASSELVFREEIDQLRAQVHRLRTGEGSGSLLVQQPGANGGGDQKAADQKANGGDGGDGRGGGTDSSDQGATTSGGGTGDVDPAESGSFTAGMGMAASRKAEGVDMTHIHGHSDPTFKAKVKSRKPSDALRSELQKGAIKRADSMHLNAFVNKHRLLLDVISEVAAVVELDKAVKILVDGSKQCLDADKVRFYLVDEAMKDLKEVGAGGAGGGSADRVLQFGESYPGKVAETGQQLLVQAGDPDVIGELAVAGGGGSGDGGGGGGGGGGDGESKKTLDYYDEGYAPCTVLCVPVFDITNALVAVIEASRSRQGKFADEAMHMLDAIAIVTGGALHRTTLYVEAVTARKRNDALLEMMTTLTSEVETHKVIERIILAACRILDSCGIIFFIVDAPQHQIVRPPAGDTPELRAPMSGSIVGKVAETGTFLSVPDVREEPLYNPAVDSVPGMDAGTTLSAPVMHPKGGIMGVVHAVRPKGSYEFTEEDERILKIVADNASITLRKASLLEQARKAGSRSQALVSVVKTVHDSSSVSQDLDVFIERIVNLGYQIIDADRVTLFIIDAVRNDLFCKVSKDAKGFRVPMGVGIAGSVAATGEVVNIPDAYEDDRFNKEVDRKTGYHTKSILCVPINDRQQKVVAVLQCINKGGNVPFDEYDEAMVREFSDEVGIVLARRQLEAAYHSVLTDDSTEETKKNKDWLSQYTKKQAADKKEEGKVKKSKRLSNMERKSMLSGFAAAGQSFSMGGTVTVQVPTEILDEIIDIHDFSLDVLVYDFNMLRGFVLAMLQEHQVFIAGFDQDAMSRFIIEVSRNYRQNSYHNFYHAVGVMHVAFMFLNNCAADFVTPMDCLAILLAALCHDLDHPGVNNTFEASSMSERAVRYNDVSILENYHAALTFTIMTDDKINLMDPLEVAKRKELRKAMIGGILATDMTHHFSLTETIKNIAEQAPEGGATKDAINPDDAKDRQVRDGWRREEGKEERMKG